MTTRSEPDPSPNVASPPPARRGLGPLQLVLLMCAAQVLVQLGAYTWPALLPGYLTRWGIDNGEAGWITGVFYLAYTLSVPLLVSATDRIDPKRVYLFGVATTVVAHAAFALFVDGLWSAIAARVLAGIGWAGTYMTGLKLLADRVEGKLMSRAVAGHAASVGVAGALSFVVADLNASLIGPDQAFAIAAGSAAIAWCSIALLAPRAAARAASVSRGALLDFRPVLRNRAAMAYAVGYAAHTFEMSALRGWAVAFMAFAAVASGGGEQWLAPSAVATAMALIGTLASVAGNELSLKLGRARVVRGAMLGSVLCAAAIGFSAEAGYVVAAFMVIAYGAVIWLDSSSLTAGTALYAEPERRGATLAVHSMLGYAGGFVGPLVVGFSLDAAGGASGRAWTAAFWWVAAVVLGGRIAFGLLIRGQRQAGPDTGA
ncbi:MAG: MFS transporter [Gammaproteobacteria bacterium]|nr:MFS transporter [Gammaproteobacteria bacterium]